MALMIRKLVILIVFPLVILHSSGSTFAQDACRQVAGQQDFQLRASYGNQIDFWLRIAGALQAKGVDPANFPQAMPDGSIQIINIPLLIHMLAAQRDTALGAIFQSFQQCAAGFAPYQQIINVGIFYMTGGISQILPPAATHVDASQILGGTPFGGGAALIPQARSQVLNGLGIGGDVRKVIENPRCIFGC